MSHNRPRSYKACIIESESSILKPVKDFSYENRLFLIKGIIMANIKNKLDINVYAIKEKFIK